MSDPNGPVEATPTPADTTAPPVEATAPPVVDPDAAAAPPVKRRVPVTLLVAILVPVLVLGSAGAWAATNSQYISDQITVWGYESTPGIDDYIDDSTMTDHALFLFAASKPRIAPDSEFNKICGSNEGRDGTLGCYTTDKKRITLFEIADERLAGLQEAVASHEMLHAAWDRLGEGERDRLAPLLDAEFERLADDDAFQDQIDAYDFHDDAVRYNELHSIIATEVEGISKELESYYAQYFDDRDALVALYTEANDVLVEIAEAVTALNDEIEALNDEIEADSARYDSGWDVLSADFDAFNERNEAYYYKTQRAFDADRDALYAREDALDLLLDQINEKIDLYNEKVDELSELDERAAELYDSINLEPESQSL